MTCTLLRAIRAQKYTFFLNSSSSLQKKSQYASPFNCFRVKETKKRQKRKKRNKTPKAYLGNKMREHVSYALQMLRRTSSESTQLYLRYSYDLRTTTERPCNVKPTSLVSMASKGNLSILPFPAGYASRWRQRGGSSGD